MNWQYGASSFRNLRGITITRSFRPTLSTTMHVPSNNLEWHDEMVNNLGQALGRHLNPRWTTKKQFEIKTKTPTRPSTPLRELMPAIDPEPCKHNF